MAFIWNAKNNFILSHCVMLHQQQQSSNMDIDWPSIVNNIRLEITSTPNLLKDQYECLVKDFYAKEESCLHSILKRTYLDSLCQNIEDDSNSILETVYELIRHARAKRIVAEDIRLLLKEWNFNYTSDEEKKNKDRLLDTLKRLLHYIHTLPSNHHQYKSPYLSTNSNEKFISCRKGMQDENLELVSESDDNDISKTYISKNQIKQSINIDNPWTTLNVIEHDESSRTRRRTKSLTFFDGNKDNQVNIGSEWFLPKLKRQQRSLSLHEQSHSSLSNDFIPLKKHNLQRLVTTVTDDQFSDSISNSNIRKTHAQPSISWLPLTNEQAAEKEHQREQTKLINNEKCIELDQISSSDSESTEVKRTLDQHQRSIYKRQRLS